MYGAGYKHDLNHDLTFYAHTNKFVCHSIRSMFRVLGVYNFVPIFNQDYVKIENILLCYYEGYYHQATMNGLKWHVRSCT